MHSKVLLLEVLHTHTDHVLLLIWLMFFLCPEVHKIIDEGAIIEVSAMNEKTLYVAQRKFPVNVHLLYPVIFLVYAQPPLDGLPHQQIWVDYICN